MRYFSLNHQSPAVTFKEAAIQGQAPDEGLYYPEKLPTISRHLVENIENIADVDIAFEVMKPYVSGTLTDDVLYSIIQQTVSFPMPLHPINNTVFSLELFHGPTLAFKDIGARFMSRCLGHFLQNEVKEVTVLVATSGDTGGAVANGFYGVENVKVVILYPKDRVSAVQEKQLTTLGENITALEVEGTFDDCQRMVKQAFADKEINAQKWLTSANSINVARWLPQQVYYFIAYKQWKDKSNAPVVCVPSGNFGNICAGLLAKVTGLPLGHFIAACNANDVVSHYLQTRELNPRHTVPTLSNAMDVGNPSNFVRIIQLFQQQHSELKNSLSSATVTDEQTIATIKKVNNAYQYILDPHGAVAYFALENYLQQHQHLKGLILETAHPVKFPDAVESVIGKQIPIPQVLNEMMSRTKKSKITKPQFEALKSYLLNN